MNYLPCLCKHEKMVDQSEMWKALSRIKNVEPSVHKHCCIQNNMQEQLYVQVTNIYLDIVLSLKSTTITRSAIENKTQEVDRVLCANLWSH